MSEVGADKKAEMPERSRKAGDGIAEGPVIARQTDAAHRDQAGDGSLRLRERAVRRENLASRGPQREHQRLASFA